MEHFATDLKSKDISLYMPYGYDCDYIKATILWVVDFELRAWGVKSIEIIVDEVRVNYTEINLDTEEEKEKEIVITENIKIGEPTEFGIIYPSQIAIDKKGVCSVEF